MQAIKLDVQNNRKASGRPMTAFRRLHVVWFVLLSSMAAWAQSVPQVEFAAGYTYMDFHANVPQLTSESFNGGGGAVVFNPLSWLGVKAEIMGYSFGSDWTHKLLALGYTGTSGTSLFTYQFGPQYKKHSGKFQPYIQSLYGVAHSSGYEAVLRARGTGTYVLTSGGGNNAFAMELGGGLDIPISSHLQLRPAELDYQLTRFGFRNFSANQNNFKYFGGINFIFGER
jgi:hypothetical protein